MTVGTAPNTVKVAFIGVTTTETPIITVATATAGLCFKDPAESILHYYDAMKAAGADVIVVLSHLGYHRRRLRLRHPGLRRPDPGRQAEHRRQARQPDHRRSQPHQPDAPQRWSATPTDRAGLLQRPQGRPGRRHGRTPIGAVVESSGQERPAHRHRRAPPGPDDRRARSHTLRHRPGLPGAGQPRRSATPRSTCRAATTATT